MDEDWCWGGEKRNVGTRKGGACEEDGAQEAADQLRAKKIKTVAHSKAKSEQEILSKCSNNIDFRW